MSRLGLGLRGLLALLCLLAIACALAATNKEIRWRMEVIALKASGRLPDVGWLDLYGMLQPDSGFWLAPLADTPNPYAVIRSPYNTEERSIRTGRALFHWQCEQCHGPEARGGSAPALAGRDFTHGSSDWALFRTIRYGIKSTAMPPHELQSRDIWKFVAYIRSLANPKSSTAPPGFDAAHPLQVRFDQLRATGSATGDWPTYYGSYNGHRFSELRDVNRSNIEELQARWIFQLQVNGGRIQATPIVVGDRMFITSPEGNVIALDARTGQQLWRYSRALDGDVSLCCVTANRGVAVLNGTVFVQTIDAHLIALEGTSGHVLWDRLVADIHKGYSSTGAPLAVKGMVVSGIAGSEYGAAGFVTAFDARTGRPLWRFDTIPRPGQKGNDTWAGDSWRRGGVSAWMTGTYDPELNLIYWGTGNAAPDYDSSARAGDNLYSDSVVALDADTGKLAWYFQFTPADDHDWDSVQAPVLADLSDGTQTRKVLLAANRNGFFYALDRTSGKFLYAKPFVTQTWAERIDPNGRPVTRPEATPSERGSWVSPGTTGGTNWWPPTFSPQANLFVVPALERPGLFFRTAHGEARVGEKVLGGTSIGPSTGHFTVVRALDPTSGALRWEYRSAAADTGADMSGLLSTAGGLVFTGDGNRLVALDIDNGHELWSFQAGGRIYAPPVSYRAGGEQFIAFTAGGVLIGAALPPRLPILDVQAQKRTARR